MNTTTPSTVAPNDPADRTASAPWPHYEPDEIAAVQAVLSVWQGELLDGAGRPRVSRRRMPRRLALGMPLR